MPGKGGSWASRILLVAVVGTLLIAFSPISRFLLARVDGSFAPTPYSSLGLVIPSRAVSGVHKGSPVQVQLTNHTGRSKTYHWAARENGALLGHGNQSVANGKSVRLSIPTRGAASGELRIALVGTKVFVTVPLVTSKP
jgi:hypothetical protein